MTYFKSKPICEDTRERLNHEAQPSRDTERRRDEEQIRTTQTPHRKVQQRNRLGTVSRKTTGHKPVLLVRNRNFAFTYNQNESDC